MFDNPRQLESCEGCHSEMEKRGLYINLLIYSYLICTEIWVHKQFPAFLAYWNVPTVAMYQIPDVMFSSAIL